MPKGRTARVIVDAGMIREARNMLGARSNSQAVELAMVLALAIGTPGGTEAAKYLEILRSDRFKV
ncbi:hypothetical protein [Glaciihabitans sp. GrIS 2.15]|uniref:hypothetical protein n=1 Tax=Glaciihabitans sp. GrIS 2.15 TaxID=3071710 RepID=UPI002E00D55C|nr:hypothetical protein [Glaciihabitans sp. GrIS 2.15]